MSKSHKTPPTTNPAPTPVTPIAAPMPTVALTPEPTPTPVVASLVKAATVAPPVDGLRLGLRPWFTMTQTWLDQVERHSGWWLEHGLGASGELLRFARSCGTEGIGTARAMLRNTERMFQPAA